MRMTKLLVTGSTILLFAIAANFAHAQNIAIAAVYKVEFGGFDLGDFRFKSEIMENNYSMKGHTRLSILKGTVMDWRMTMHSDGKIMEDTPKPGTFGYEFRNKKKKKKQLLLRFSDTSQGSYEIEPKYTYGKEHVILRKEHLQNVYDPMSALMVLTHANGEPLSRKICDRTIRLFDGKERYDIKLNYKAVKMEEVGEKNAHRTMSYVCGLRYIPVSGHKIKDKTKNYMAGVKGIEVWFAPLKQAKMYVPHKIVIPTPFGTTTTIRTKSFEVRDHTGKQVSLIK